MADSITLRACLEKVAYELSQVPGPGTNRYSDSILSQHVEHAFKHLFRELWLPYYTRYEQFTLDGTTGQVTADLTDKIKDVKDIGSIWRADTNLSLPLLPTNINPYTITGTRPRYIQLTNDEKMFIAWPLTATGQLVIKYRTLPDLPFGLDDTIYINDMLLVYASAWWYADKDGDNPGAAKLLQGLFLQTLNDEKKRLLNLPIALHDGSGIPTEWFMR